jgi:hypothetical protein
MGRPIMKIMNLACGSIFAAWILSGYGNESSNCGKYQSEKKIGRELGI